MDNCNFQRTYNQAFLYAMGETNRSGQSKKRALTFTDFYDVVLVAITDEDGNELGVILSPSHIEQISNNACKTYATDSKASSSGYIS